MTADTRRRLRAADAAERAAVAALDAARARLAAAMDEAVTEGATIREVADVTGRGKSAVHRFVSPAR